MFLNLMRNRLKPKEVNDALIGVEKRTPKDYSTTETATGLKWTDGKDIYCKIINGVLPSIDATATVDIATNFDGILLYGHSLLFDANNRYCNRFYLSQSTTNIRLINVTTSFSGLNYSVMIYYTKPDPVPETTKKTRKKATNK